MKIKELKSWAVTKKAFINEVNVKMWEEAKEKFPLFADQNKLMKFGIKKEGDLPKIFKVCSEKVIIMYS